MTDPVATTDDELAEAVRDELVAGAVKDLHRRTVTGDRLEHPSGNDFLDVPPDAVDFASDDFLS